MATKEEEHSTRGRANALRAAFSGKIPTEELTSQRMYEVMDLCIQCKGCKAECPSSVDMAKIKNEFLAHYYKEHGVSLRTRIFANINLLSHLSSGALAPLINAVNGSAPVRWALDRYLGIGKKRTLPQFVSEPFHIWFRRRAKRLNGHQSEAKRQVVLFNDTFNTFNYPDTAIAATEVLEAAGCAVILPRHRCCGRPALSKGMLKQAKQDAKQTINKLAPLAERGLPIIGLEPSCILTLTDEYFSLLPNDRCVEIVAKQCYTFEEYMAKLANEGALDDLEFADSNRRVLLHGHCHQKALVGTRTAHTALSLPPGYTVREVDSSCCGMAGAFGYEAEHYDISLKMAELKLLPAVRDEPKETIIAAAGVSCRQQIKHGTGRQVLHPAEVLRKALG